jgi:hypothetical protein
MTSPSDAQQQPEPVVNVQAVRLDLTRSIVGISSKVRDSGLRSLIDRYLRLVAPTFAKSADSNFPRSVNQHPRDPNKSQVGGLGNLLVFHIGNAILAYYAAVRGENAEHLYARLEHLKEIADVGPMSFVSYGDDANGYMLLTADAIKAQRRLKHKGD